METYSTQHPDGYYAIESDGTATLLPEKPAPGTICYVAWRAGVMLLAAQALIGPEGQVVVTRNDSTLANSTEPFHGDRPRAQQGGEGQVGPHMRATNHRGVFVYAGIRSGIAGER